MSLLGASGAGKTTLIRAIAGLIPITKGQVIVDGQVINDLPVHKRKIGMVFQDFALFPHLNVYGNIAFGLKFQNISRSQIKNTVSELLELFGLNGYERRNISSLSGGEKQRVALARTLAPKPEIILFDEPLSAIDEELRVKLRSELAIIHQQLGFTGVYVTHDREEAFFLGDILGIFENGILLQIGTPSMTYKQPKTADIASFLGIENKITVEVKEAQNGTCIALLGKEKIHFDYSIPPKLGDFVDIYIKPEAISLVDNLSHNNSYSVRVLEIHDFGSRVECTVILNKHNLKFFSPTLNGLDINEAINIHLNQDLLLIYKNGELIS